MAMKLTSPDPLFAGLAIAAIITFAADSARAQPISQAPEIVQQPASRTNRAGAPVSFTVIASGSLPLFYQWFKDGIALADDVHFAGTHSSLLLVNQTAASDQGAYSVAIGNASGLTNSAMAMLTVNPWQPWVVVGSSPNTDEITKRVVVANNLAYLANGYVYTQPTVNTGLRIVDVTDPTMPAPMGQCRTNYAEANSVAVSGNRAYLALATSPPLGLGVVDISNPSSPSVLGAYDTTSSVAHGTDVAVSGNIAYAAVGGSLLTLDVSNPAHILGLGSWGGSYGASRVVLSGTIAYVAGSGLNVIDVTDPAHLVRLGGVSPAFISSVALSGNYAFTVGGQDLRVYDVTNPSNLVRQASLTLNNSLDLTVVGDLAYVACGTNGVAMVDISSPTTPALIGTAATLGEARSLAVVGGLGYVADGPAGLTIIQPVALPTLPPSIVGLPRGQTVAAGGSAFFSVAANGTAPLHFQWLFGNTPLDGATNSILWLTNVQPAQAGLYTAVATNAFGSATSGVAVLTVSVPPRLDIRWTNGVSRLGLFGVVGYAYAVEYAPKLPWTTAWSSLTNTTLISDAWHFEDTSSANAHQRYYRARQLDFAPDFLNGKTIVGTVTNIGPFSVTLVYGFGTFTQTNGLQTQSGTYSYFKTGPVTAWISDQSTASPEVAGNISTTQLTFTSPTEGAFVNNSFTPGDPIETAIGTFQLSNSP